MKFDMTFSNGRIDTFDVQGVNDIVDLLTLLKAKEEAGDEWLAGSLEYNIGRNNTQRFRALVRVDEIVTVSERA